LDAENTSTTSTAITSSTVLRTSPRRAALEKIEQQLYSIDSDQVPSYLQKIDEATSENVFGISNPLIILKQRGRPAGAKNRSIQRDKSRFEYAAGNKYGNCVKSGHNSRTCPN
jgi:hypothetical protein